jgi:hypothetical protein
MTEALRGLLSKQGKDPAKPKEPVPAQLEAAKVTEVTEQELEQVQGGRAPHSPTIIINY